MVPFPGAVILLYCFGIISSQGQVSQAPVTTKFERFTPVVADSFQGEASPALVTSPVGATPDANTIYSSARVTPSVMSTNVGASSASSSEDPVPDIDASVRERIEEDGKRVGKIAENLVGVQGDINRVEKEVLGKVFDMSSMKVFLDKHETAIKDHEKYEQEAADLTNQATTLSKQLDNAINETSVQDKSHRSAMTRLSSKVAEDKVVIAGLQKELVPLVEMEKEVQRFPEVNANLTAWNTRAVSAAQAATQESLYEKVKMKGYQETTKNLMKELVKQHDYATKCHSRLYQLNTQIHELQTKEAQMKYEQSQADAKGDAMEKFLEDKNVLIETRLQKAKTNLQTINFAKANVEAKIATLQTEGQMKLEKMKEELGKLRQQTASIEAAMMAKVTNRKLIEKALRGAGIQVEDLQARLLAGHLGKLRANNTQMTNDLNEIRQGLQQSQVATAKAEAEKQHYEWLVDHLKNETSATTLRAQDVAREALAKVVAVKAEANEATQKAEEATLAAQASQLQKCDAIWVKEHPKVLEKIKACVQVKVDLDAMKANVASLTATVKAAQR
eukprot:CAMPEP_0169226284 /NCGR_PEP_ID=MMETSP1016-20121227/23660_1 /TAXON_ID=342587 /ORGANISM="Karlodinium micrum, Strain CCMP2283" /LENGTH=560 /DNA_ID=CAMNT_0009304869 /DNA_START=60 /DNA_END=1742 /DNA_ORIENTATION=-